MKIPFSKVPLAGNEMKYLKEVLESGWLTSSSKVFSLEKQFAGYIGVKYACAVNSCTSALHLAVEALGIEKGDKVMVPSLTFTATAEVIRYMGADPVFTDVEYGTGLITPEIIEASLEKHRNIKAVIPVHFGGQAAQLLSGEKPGILEVCERNGIGVIEDAAHAFPTKIGDRYIGSFGDVSCFSFYANKTITTGEGGMLVTNKEHIFERAKTMRLHGIDRDIWQRYTSERPAWEYDVVAPGFKYNMPDVNAAIGVAQLEKAEYFRGQRQRCAALYYDLLGDLDNIDLPVYRGTMEDHSWHLFPVVILPQSPVSRNSFIQKMADSGIGTSVHYKPLHRMSYYRDTYNLSPGEFPNTEKIWKGVVSLPIYPDLNNEELEYICLAIKRILRK
ncbi:MAG: DegT/DnrJ/EryC1/StrS family aminotransferase [Bacteroidota bacterium]